ncbi:MAG: c-type cytochrome [Burkholderiaceae bacterium]
MRDERMCGRPRRGRERSVLQDVLLAVLALLALLGLMGPMPARSEDDLGDRLQACTGCHGEQGRAGPEGYYPRIAGKPEGYLLQQLLHFRDGRRKTPSMVWMVQGLRDESLAQIARYFSQQELPYPEPAASARTAAAIAPPSLIAHGQKLALRGDPDRQLPACAQCHGERLTGVSPSVPGLLGLSRDYLNAQLGAWRNGERKAAEPDCMAQIARALTGEDLIAVTTWLAAQSVPASGRPATQEEHSGRPPGKHARQAEPMQAGQTQVASSDQAMRCGTANISAHPGAKPTEALAPELARGAYLARIGNCAGCHTAPGGVPYAGGKAIATPFGTVYGGNLTPHATGLAGWSAEDFWKSMHQGRSRDGRALNPAFPYTDFTRIRREDSDALFAWLQSLPAVDAPARKAELRFPWSLPGLLRLWQWLFFKPAAFEPVASQSADWNRGAYLVQGLGHCGACHTPRNALGAPRAAGHTAVALSGAELPAQGWHAPSLRTASSGGVGHWSLGSIEQWLSTGNAPEGKANGPMARIVGESLHALVPEDRRAMAVYLKSLSPELAPLQNAGLPAAASSQTQAASEASSLAKGVRPAFPQDGSPPQALYREHCAQCHGDHGEGHGPLWPALAGNRVLTQPTLTNAARIMLHGGFGADVPGGPVPAGMPPFAGVLSDAQVTGLLRWMRDSGAAHPQDLAADRRGLEIQASRVNALRSPPVD